MALRVGDRDATALLALPAAVPPSDSDLTGEAARRPAADAGPGARSPDAGDREPDTVSGAHARLGDQVGEQPVENDSKGVLRRHLIAAVIGAIALVVLATAGYLYWDFAGHFQSTDDAFIAARQFSVAPKVSGYLTAVAVTDNQHVAAGEVMARIDDRDFQVALEQADAQVGVAQANIQNIDAQVSVQQAQINANQAQVDQALANLELARVTWARDKPLVEKGWTTAQQGTIDVQNLKAQQATVENAQANLTLAKRQLASFGAQRKSAEASLAQAKAQRDQAQLNLSYTVVTAAQAGRVVNLTAAVGGFAQAGMALTIFVPDDIWITANYKETQLTDMRPDQPVTLSIDAYPDRLIKGHVDSVQPGSGTAFSLLPAQNATGNFVKIVQRVPVKLVMDEPPNDVALGPGMSVVPTVRIDPAPSLYERLTARL
ncbi:MAG TPA: HlyD family secretion protein [Sphingomicrobium sp.]|nr:HlyD family secretion protein [Sphingomicrobium sp.]